LEKPKTIRGYVNLIRKIELIDPSALKGYEKLSKKTKDEIGKLSAEISNIVNEIEEI